MTGTYYYLNGTYIHSYQIAFQKLQRAIWYGESAFETIRIQEHTREQFLPFHIKRLDQAAQILGIKMNTEQVQNSIHKILAKHSTGTLRVLLFREPGGKYKPIHEQANFLFEVNTEQYQAPERLKWNIKDVTVKEVGSLSGIKSHCYPYIQAGIQRESQVSLLIDSEHQILEWEIGAFIWKQGNQFFTIPKDNGQVNSVFVDAVHHGKVLLPDGQQLLESACKLSEIKLFDQLYIGNAVMGLVPIEQI